MNENKVFKIEKIIRLINTTEVATLEDCIRKLELHFIPVGEGGNAIVYCALGTSFIKIVFKKIKEKPQIHYNDIDEEHKLQEKVKELGVNTPLTLLSIETTDGKYLVMEKVEGHSVKDIIENNNLLPEKFDYKVFCDSLDEQIAKMHNKGKVADGVYHRDLHSGNVMINMEGLPVIIDFGTGTEGTGSDFTYEEGVSMYNEKKGAYEFVTGYFKDDLEMVKNIKAELKKFMKE